MGSIRVARKAGNHVASSATAERNSTPDRKVAGSDAFTRLLAAVGIYGVLSYAVTQRTREIGIRMSLGASRGRVPADVMREGMRLALVGFAAGIAGAFACGRLLATLLYEVKPGDPVILAATAGLLAVVALVACYLPARRAAGLEPANALRHE